MSNQERESQLSNLRQLYRQGVLTEDHYRAALIRLGLSPAAVFVVMTRWIR